MPLGDEGIVQRNARKDQQAHPVIVEERTETFMTIAQTYQVLLIHKQGRCPYQAKQKKHHEHAEQQAIDNEHVLK